MTIAAGAIQIQDLVRGRISLGDTTLKRPGLKAAVTTAVETIIVTAVETGIVTAVIGDKLNPGVFCR
jgi:hypothetical protein